MPAPKAAEHPWPERRKPATAVKVDSSAALEAREQELKTERAKLLAGRRRVRVRTATVKRVATAEDAGTKRDADAREWEDSRGKRQA